jgi:uncharacterized protein (TIGR00375 family)
MGEKLRVIADLHIHGPYSRATSERMCVEEIARFAAIKGLNVVGTGDFTHPKWFDELRQKLASDSDRQLYRLRDGKSSSIRFMITTEVCTIFRDQNDLKKVHHVILTPSLETATQINDRLSKYGNLEVDGRPTLNISGSALVEEVMETSQDNMIFPAHAWTPWFSVLGAFSGFDSVEDCYQDMTKNIHALETGLSSDPPMNWRLSNLDRFTLLSNSDCHSFWPWRIGREANVFELEEASYKQITEVIRLKDAARFKFTIETDPAYGKYHWTGHRACNVALSAREAIKLADICPSCRKKLTKGVEQRVEELADRPEGFQPENRVGFVRLLPMSEIIAAVLDSESPSAQRVWNVYNSLIAKFGNEYSASIDASEDELRVVAGEKVAETIVRVREGKAKVAPGYDGVYGQLVLTEKQVQKSTFTRKVKQSNLTDFSQ